MIGTPWDDGGEAPVTSVNGYQGVVVLTPGDIGADPEGAGIAAVADHTGESDPHPGYQLRSEAGQAGGYAQLNPDALVLQDPASALRAYPPTGLNTADIDAFLARNRAALLRQLTQALGGAPA